MGEEGNPIPYTENINELIYTPIPITLSNGNYVEKGFYPANPAAGSPDTYINFFVPGSQFFIRLTKDFSYFPFRVLTLVLKL